MILKSLKHEALIVTEVNSLITMVILCMSKIVMNFDPSRVQYAYELELVEGHGLEVKVAARLIDPLLVTLLEESLPFNRFIFNALLV